MSTKSGSFTLQSVVVEDAAPLAKIGANSFVNDRNTLVKGLGKDPYKLEEVLKDPLEHYLSLPHKIQCIKAVDDDTGERMGYVYWGFRGWAPEDIPTLLGKGVPNPESAKTASADEKEEEEEEEEKVEEEEKCRQRQEGKRKQGKTKKGKEKRERKKRTARLVPMRSMCVGVNVFHLPYSFPTFATYFVCLLAHAHHRQHTSTAHINTLPWQGMRVKE